MRTETPYFELCPTCIHSLNCMRKDEFKLPIVYCERYRSDPSLPYNPALNYELKGLCKTCVNRYVCVLAKQEGGVWHCNDYQ